MGRGDGEDAVDARGDSARETCSVKTTVGLGFTSEIESWGRAGNGGCGGREAKLLG